MSHPFEVGQVYANRNGSYEVLSIDERRGTMQVRYLETDAEAELIIRIQQRIWENLALEEQIASRRAAEREVRHMQRYGEDFAGLTEADFTAAPVGVTWRSRRGLAGRVARLLSETTPYTFLPWSSEGWPVAYLVHRENYEIANSDMSSRKARFMIEIDESGVYYGFHIERSSTAMDDTWDWPQLMARLKASDRLSLVISRAESQYGARLVGRISEEEELTRYHMPGAERPLWDENHIGTTSIEERLEVLNDLPEGQWCRVYIMVHRDREQAMAAGAAIADQIASFMQHLLPIYEAAVT
ncbi:MAG: hypothetical protein Kow00124_29920 [Anaerolineae bacterium]